MALLCTTFFVAVSGDTNPDGTCALGGNDVARCYGDHDGIADCDGDGIADAVCTSNGYFIYAKSTESCRTTWVTGTNAPCPSVPLAPCTASGRPFSHNHPAQDCETHGGTIRDDLDCDGDGVMDAICTRNGELDYGDNTVTVLSASSYTDRGYGCEIQTNAVCTLQRPPSGEQKPCTASALHPISMVNCAVKDFLKCGVSVYYPASWIYIPACF